MAFELTGVNELIANLERVGNNVEQVKKRALNEGADVIKQSAKQKCPRDTSARNLAKKYSTGKHLADNIIISDVKLGSNGKPYVEIGPQLGDNNDFFYGKFLEFGTEKMDAQPFMEPAFIEKRQQALDKIADVIRGAIQGV
jgi:HK97 gp10 family phage protein